MYKCKECGGIFDEPDTISAESFYGVSGLFDYSYGEKVSLCPYCQNTRFDEYDEDEEDDDR